VVEHELDVVRHADWIVDVGPGAGEQGGEVLYSGPPPGLSDVSASLTRNYLFAPGNKTARMRRSAHDWLKLRGVKRNNLNGLDVEIPLGLFTSVTGVSGSGKSSLISQFLVEAVAEKLGQRSAIAVDDENSLDAVVNTTAGEVVGLDSIKRLVVVDQKPIGRTPRSNLATYTGLFDHVRKLFAATKQPGPGATIPADFLSTSQRAVARPARAKVSSASNSCSCPASTRLARPAKARAIIQRHLR
jgi:excinuclease ABC subunit A